MNNAQAEIRAARERLQTQGWIARRSEAFHHLPPPALQDWLGTQAGVVDEASLPAGAGWTLRLPHAQAATSVQARWLDALDPAQRAELMAGLPSPESGSGDGAAAPFTWAHRALCRRGLRLRVAATPGREREPVRLELHHQPGAAAEAPLLVLDVEAGVQCVLIETHERPAADGLSAVAQNLHAHIRLAQGAQLQHLRVAAPLADDRVAHHLQVHVAAGAAYAQALVATGASYHLQRSHITLQGAGASARQAALLLLADGKLDQQTYTDLQAAQAVSQVETLALAQGRAHAVANAYTRIAPGSDGADVRQRLAGVPLAGQPRLILRPHLEILHDNVQAAHGATWGALPEDALFYARQRGLDDAAARALIIEGMAQALLDRCLGAEGDGMLAQWLQSGWLAGAIARLKPTAEEAHHG